mgnify:CR=1 FL=1
MSEDVKLPWFKFYPQEFMGDENVQLMGPSELGIYIAMLCHQWKAGAVPDDPRMVARICRGTPEQVEKAWDLVRPCFKEHPDRDGFIIQPRLEKERQAALNRKEAARKAAQARHGSQEQPDSDRNSGGSAAAPAAATAGGGADGGADDPAMRASDASDGQRDRDTDDSGDSTLPSVESSSPGEPGNESDSEESPVPDDIGTWILETPRPEDRERFASKHFVRGIWALWKGREPPENAPTDSYSVGADLGKLKQRFDATPVSNLEVAQFLGGVVELRNRGEYAGIDPDEGMTLGLVDRMAENGGTSEWSKARRAGIEAAEAAAGDEAEGLLESLASGEGVPA